MLSYFNMSLLQKKRERGEREWGEETGKREGERRRAKDSAQVSDYGETGQSVRGGCLNNGPLIREKARI